MNTDKPEQQLSAAMKNIKKAFFALVVLFGAGAAFAADPLAVETLEFAALPGNQMEIRLGFNGAPPAPTGYAIEKPARIALDIVGAKSQLEAKHHNLGTGNARSMTVVEARDRTRVIVNLQELVGYTTRVEGNQLVIEIGEDIAASRDASVASAAPADSAGAAATGGGIKGSVVGRGIAGIDFRRGQDGEGQVVVNMTSAAIPVDVRQDGNRIVAEFLGASLPENLRRKLDVTDFATPVTSIVTAPDGENVLMVIQPSGQYEYLAYQADKEMIIGIKPVTQAEREKRQKDAFIYTGEKLSLNFQDIEVRSVLQLIADFTSLNLVASDTVSGRITLRLQNVPWDQALDLVLKTKSLDKRQVGNVLLVAPADEIAARERLEMESYQQSEALAPLRSEFFQVNYATAADISKLLTADKSVLSGRGSVNVDERTNTLIVVETSNKLEQIRDLIKRLDIPVRQVMIEARIVLATTDFSKALGVRWGMNGYDADGGRINLANGNLTGLTNSIEGNVAVSAPTGTGLNTSLEAGLADQTFSEGGGDNLMVDMGVPGATSSLAVGVLDLASGLLEFELSALAADGHGEIVATPKVMTADQQEAFIASGTQIAYNEESGSGGTTTAFKDAELRLAVKPQITPDGSIVMELKVNNDSIGDFTPAGAPTINTQRMETVVLINDGDTVVLGGIYRTETVRSVIKTPFLGDIPIIGRLFRRDIRRDAKQELLIFITPKVMKELTASN